MIPPEICTRLDTEVVKVESKLSIALCPQVMVCCAGVSVQLGAGAMTFNGAVQVVLPLGLLTVSETRKFPGD